MPRRKTLQEHKLDSLAEVSLKALYFEIYLCVQYSLALLNGNLDCCSQSCLFECPLFPFLPF